jgi:hypothetical protein
VAQVDFSFSLSCATSLSHRRVASIVLLKINWRRQMNHVGGLLRHFQTVIIFATIAKALVSCVIKPIKALWILLVVSFCAI